MPEIRTLKTVSGQGIRIASVSSGSLRAARVQTAVINWEGEPYDGPTEVESHLYDPVILETRHKTMMDNVTVLPITILDVDNPAGGYTVTIGRF